MSTILSVKLFLPQTANKRIKSIADKFAVKLASKKSAIKWQLVATALLAVPAFAVLPTPQNLAQSGQIAEQYHIAPKLSAFVVTANGLVPVTASTRVQSGDLLEYQAFLTNNGSERLGNLTVTLQLPPTTTLTDMTGENLFGSVDGANFAPAPMLADLGGGKIGELPKQYYKALQWRLEDLRTGETARVAYRAQVN